MKHIRWAMVLIMLLGGLCPASSGPEGYQSPAAEEFPDLLLPAKLRHLNHSNPSVTLIVRVGTEGEVLDHIITQADHPDLVGPVERALREARFKPARDSTGAQVADLILEVHFREPGQELTRTVAMSVVDHIEENIQGLANPRPVLEVSHPLELDQSLAVAEPGETMIPVDAEGQPLKGSALLEFYIDADGVPRLPKVVSSDHPEITKAALHRLSGLRFEPPTRKGKPTVVKARLPFNFH